MRDLRGPVTTEASAGACSLGLAVAGALCELCVFARRRRYWLAEQRRRRDAATSVTLPVALVPEDDARDAADAPLTSPRRRQSHDAHHTA